MSTITYNSALVEKNYRQGLILESSLSTPTAELEGTSPTSAFVVEDRESSGRGDNIELRFSAIDLTEKPKTIGDASIGSEGDTVEYTDSVVMRYYKIDRFIDNLPVEQNLVSFPLKEEKIRSMSLFWAYWKERCLMNQLTGNTLVNSETDYKLSGGNIVTAQDSSHILYCPDGSGTNTTAAQVAADSTSVMTTRVIDDLVKRATAYDYVRFPIVPCDTPFGKYFMLLVGPDGFEQIKQNGAASDFYDLSKAAIQGGEDLMDSPLMTKEGFIYGKTLVLKTQFSPPGITSSAAQANTRMAAFFGARACNVIYGSGYTEGNNLGYKEFEALRRLTMMSDTLQGFKRCIVNGQSWGAMSVVHYVPIT